MVDRTLVVHTDGGSRGNPGPGAIGVVVEEDGQIIDAFGRFIGNRVTNNQAEYVAVEAALGRCHELGGTHLHFFLDSELVVSQLRHEYKVKDKELGSIFLRIWNLTQRFKKVTFTSISREKNSLADAKVNEALTAAGF